MLPAIAARWRRAGAGSCSGSIGEASFGINSVTASSTISDVMTGLPAAAATMRDRAHTRLIRRGRPAAFATTVLIAAAEDVTCGVVITHRLEAANHRDHPLQLGKTEQFEACRKLRPTAEENAQRTIC